MGINLTQTKQRFPFSLSLSAECNLSFAVGQRGQPPGRRCPQQRRHCQDTNIGIVAAVLGEVEVKETSQVMGRLDRIPKLPRKPFALCTALMF